MITATIPIPLYGVKKISDSHAPTPLLLLLFPLLLLPSMPPPHVTFLYIFSATALTALRCALLLQVSSTQAPTRAQQYRQRRLQRVVVGIGRSINVSVLVGGPLCDVVFVVVVAVVVVGAAAVAVVCLPVSQYKYLFALFFVRFKVRSK